MVCCKCMWVLLPLVALLHGVRSFVLPGSWTIANNRILSNPSLSPLPLGTPVTSVVHRNAEREEKLQLFAKEDGRGEKETNWLQSGMILRGIDPKLYTSLLLGENIVGVFGVALAALFRVDVIGSSELTLEAIQQGALWSLIPFLASVALEKSGIAFFKKIDQDTRLYALQIFGSQRNIGRIFLPAAVLSLSAGVCEEILFRGFLLQALMPVIGPYPALAVSSVLFGLAHDPVPGANSFVEMLYGLNFGALYLVSGGNIWAAIACHTLYDLFTFLEVHLRATEGINEALEDVQAQREWPGGKAMSARVELMRKKYNLSPQFLQMAAAVFKQLDLDKNGGVDSSELQLGMRTFGRFSSDEEVQKIMTEADADKNGLITLDEYIEILVKGALALKQAPNPKR